MGIFKSFGQNPSGKRLERVTASPNYKEGEFQNISATELMQRKASMLKMTWRFFNKPTNTTPSHILPSIKTDLKKLRSVKPVIIWFGHSSYLIHINGKNILVDPVFSGHASPFNFGARSFKGTDTYKTDDMPMIDLLIITHDHYDHLDHRTLEKLKLKIRTVCTSLGVASHLIYWGFDERKITEFDWWDRHVPTEGVELIAAPARHFSGRTMLRNKTLWSSFILKSGGYTIYIGSDSGYDSHFKTIGERFGPFDIAILETGQYNEDWPLIHMMPEEAVLASLDLRAKVMFPVHWGKFAIAFHPWEEPIQRVLKKAAETGVQVTIPKIGEPIIVGENFPGSHWWNN